MEQLKITPEVAEQEVESWLDFKKVEQKKREKYKENIETLVNAICSGTLTLNSESYVFTQSLIFPLTANEKGKENITVISLDYKPRLKVRDIQVQLVGVKSSDLHGMIIAHIVALTGQVRGVIDKLDTEDYSIAQSVAIFFLG